MRYGACVLLLAAATLHMFEKPARAAEGATGAYLLGSRAAGAGITPPPGVYFQDDTYFYSGKIGSGTTLATGGLLVANVSATTWLNLPTTIWVTPAKILGGDLAFSVTSSVGEPRVNASLLVNSPRFGPIGVNASDDNVRLSDFFVNSFVGWHAGNFHWQLGVGAVIPSGTYVLGDLSNASLNRRALDLFGALTWLDPALGWDLSGAAGFTFNEVNRATDYKTGNEFHLEWAATKYLTKEFTVGLVGYYYQQLTADSGTGARIGAFEGRVVALGGSIGYTFKLGKLPVSTRIKVYREFDVQNRMEGTAGFFTVALPLAIDTNSQLASSKPIKTRVLAAGSRGMNGQLAVNTSGLESFEGLHNAIRGSHVEVTQLGRGKFRGALSHVGIGDFSLSIGSFSVGVRTQRVSTDDKLVVGMLLSADDRVTHWSFDMRPADVLIMPPNIEHDGIFHGASSYAAIRLDLAEVMSLFKGEARLSDPAAWLSKNVYQADPLVGIAATQRLPLIISQLARQQTALSDEVADFWKRSIIDAVTGTIRQSLPPDSRGLLPSATQLVRKVDEYLDSAGLRPVHVSEICAHLNVSRRTLHRAFYDVFGLGPISFLRHKRLCATHSVLRDSDPAKVTVAQVAIQHGFIELGRFSHYYHSLFGEYPSETLGSRAAQPLYGLRAARRHA